MKKFKFLFLLLLTSGCINQSWADAKHTPQTEDKPKLQPPSAAQPNSGGSADDDYKKCGNYYMGKGVPKNDIEAFKYCQQSAQAGNPNAMYNLALFYQKGEGTQQNYNEAEKWFKAAADKGQSDAKFDLKQLQMAKTGGMGVPKPAADAGAAGAAKPAATAGVSAVAAGAGAAATAGGISITQYCLIAAERGNPDPKCKQDLAKQTPPKQPTSSLDSYIAAAKTGNPQAQNDLGVFYRRGLDGTKKNPAEAQKLFENAAAKGSTNGMLNLASMYKDGDVQQNLELAYAWYNLAGDRIQPGDARKAKAQDNVKEVAHYLSNEQIGNALQYVTKLDEKIPVIAEPAAAQAKP